MLVRTESNCSSFKQNNLEEMSKAMGLELERQSGQIEGLDNRVCLRIVQISFLTCFKLKHDTCLGKP